MTGHVAAMAFAALGVNGPEGDPWNWDVINWRAQEEVVRRLRQRIFNAVQAGNHKQVRNLQKLMLRSRANILISVRQVAQQNAGRRTPGVDGEVALTPHTRSELAKALHRDSTPWRARPVKRVYIPKANGKQRPLGIPIMADRAQQARVRNALEPEWEARFERRSYGFRPGRSCHDAIEALFKALRGANPRRPWVLDADLTAAFDRIDHNHLMSALEHFPAREMIRGWLKAGVVDKGMFAPTEEGTPQGGVISPLLLNVALHGLEQAAGVRYRGGQSADTTAPGAPLLVRYADDLVVLCHSHGQALQTKEKLAQWLANRGLGFNEQKTRIAHVHQGFDFLGFNVRRYPNGKLLIKPSKAAVRRIKKRLSDEMRSLRGANAAAVLRRINPIVRGWAAYYRTVVSKATFNAVDRHMWLLAYKWAKHTHQKKSRKWIRSRYFGRFNESRNDTWVFGDRDTGAYLVKFSWMKIVRHPLVKGTASPDDPRLQDYWANRRRRSTGLPVKQSTQRLIQAQRGLCPICRCLLLHADHAPATAEGWVKWAHGIHTAIAANAITYHAQCKPDRTGIRLVHADCRRRIVADSRPTE